jgi:general secretion pathway protein A
MYREFFGLQKKQFELTSDWRSLFLSETHRQGLATLKYGVISNSGFLVLTGGVGTGKTTLINALVAELKDSHYLCLLSNPILEVSDFYRYFAAKLGLRYDGNKSHFLLTLSQLLEKCLITSRKVLLIIDEAHTLPYDLFEEIRFLENISAEQKNVLSIFLVGQPELFDRLAEERLRPVRQRVGIRFHLDPLTGADIRAYINYRLMIAGRDKSLDELFTDKAIEYIHQATNGVPRIINVLCDNAMLTAYARGCKRIDYDIILECIKQTRIPGNENMPEPIAEKGFWEKWLWPLVAIGVAVEIVATWLAFRFGLIDYIVGLFR